MPRFEYLKELMVNGDFYVASRCRYWLATVPTLPRDSRNPEDVDSAANDHMLDATSYLITGQRPGARMSHFGSTAEPPREERVIWV